jgi:hypothetical protein
MRVKQPGSEADTCIWNQGQVWLSYTSTAPYIIMLWCLIEHRDNFKFFYRMTATDTYWQIGWRVSTLMLEQNKSASKHCYLQECWLYLQCH